jgi:cytidine deaminase
MTQLTADEQALVSAARAAMGNAYAPYSRFAVGAALRLSDGSILTGSNFENASYGLSLCAETVAVAAANASGRMKDIVAVAVAGAPMDGPQDAVVTPCGRCRQILNEAQDVAGREIPILCVAADGSVTVRHRLADLLPHAFGPANLG